MLCSGLLLKISKEREVNPAYQRNVKVNPACGEQTNVLPFRFSVREVGNLQSRSCPLVYVYYIRIFKPRSSWVEQINWKRCIRVRTGR